MANVYRGMKVTLVTISPNNAVLPNIQNKCINMYVYTVFHGSEKWKSRFCVMSISLGVLGFR